jgi:tyrosinase
VLSSNPNLVVFWFHHCQIDRLFAIWQACNPEVWFPTDPGEVDNLTRRGVYWDPTEPLLPFRNKTKDLANPKDKAGFWNSNASQSVKAFGYTYGDVEASPVLKTFEDNYSWFTRKNRGDKFQPCPSNMRPLDMTKAQIFQFSAAELKESAIPTAKAVAQTVISGATKVMAAAPVKRMAAKAAPQSVLKNEVDPSSRSFIGPTESTPKINPEDIDETQVSRSWYIDMLVER